MIKRSILLCLLILSSLFLIACNGKTDDNNNSGDTDNKLTAVEFTSDAIKEIFSYEDTQEIEVVKGLWTIYDIEYTMNGQPAERTVATHYFTYKVEGETRYMSITHTKIGDINAGSSSENYSSEKEMQNEHDEDLSSIKNMRKSFNQQGMVLKELAYNNGTLSKSEISSAFSKAKE